MASFLVVVGLAQAATRCPVVIDVRGAGQFEAAHISCASHASLGRIQNDVPYIASLTESNYSTPIVTYCNNGVAAQMGKDYLEAQGYTEVYNGGDIAVDGAQLEAYCTNCHGGHYNGTLGNTGTVDNASDGGDDESVMTPFNVAMIACIVLLTVGGAGYYCAYHKQADCGGPGSGLKTVSKAVPGAVAVKGADPHTHLDISPDGVHNPITL